MYISASSSSSSALSSILRARSRLFASSPYLSRTFAASSSSPPPVSGYRSLSFSSAVRSLRCSVPRWSHGVDWRSPISLRSQIRAVAPVIEQFQRKIATMGILTLTHYCLQFFRTFFIYAFCSVWLLRKPRKGKGKGKVKLYFVFPTLLKSTELKAK